MITTPDIDENSGIPKYKQVMKLIISDIQFGIFRQGERIPSINETSAEYLLARDTVEKAYKMLKKEGIIKAVAGKGYFVAKTHLSNQLRICMLFNKMSNYKKETYDSFVNALKDKAIVDLFIYNYNLKVFERIVDENLNDYDYFVIVPHFLPGTVGVENVIKKIPPEKVLIIDKKIPSLTGNYPIVYQDFEEDIIEAMETGRELLKKYSMLILSFPRYRYFSREIAVGFSRFCKTWHFEHEIIDRIEESELKPGQAWVLISDEDLVYFIKASHRLGLTLGKDIGAISYNESAVKEILANGITTISTNHEKIGEAAAQMLLAGRRDKLKIPFALNQRNSL